MAANLPRQAVARYNREEFEAATETRSPLEVRRCHARRYVPVSEFAATRNSLTPSGRPVGQGIAQRRRATSSRLTPKGNGTRERASATKVARSSAFSQRGGILSSLRTAAAGRP